MKKCCYNCSCFVLFEDGEYFCTKEVFDIITTIKECKEKNYSHWEEDFDESSKY